ncbi:hypothetical protein ES705_31903 [subsurface metagenome]|jgi:hypothetical protein
MTWVDIGLIFLVVVVGSVVAGIIATWWEERKGDKTKRG